MKVDVEDWCTGYGGRKMRGSSGLQMEMTCPLCSKPRHLYVALEKRIKPTRVTYPGDFICMKCDYRGRFVKLFAELEGMDRVEARKALMEGIREPLPDKPKFMTPKAVGTMPAVYAPPKPPEAPSPEVAAEEAPAAPIVLDAEGRPATPLPEEFTPCFDGVKWRIPQYLKDRNINRATISAFGLGYCDTGKYGGRIILPVDCPDGKSFTSRALDPDAFLRYYAGAGCGRLLFGWNQAVARIEKGARILVVNEGPFDVLSVYQAGYAVVGIMGKRFKAEQVSMIVRLPVDRIVMMLDKDALRDAVKQSPELGRRAMVAAEMDAKDANEGGTESIKRAVEGAVQVESARTKLLTSSVAKMRAKMLGSLR